MSLTGVNPEEPGDVSQVVDHLFRHEGGKMVATLTRIFGVEHLELAEDVVQEALSRALRTWAFYGVPQNPAAWIMRTSRNLALDVVRRERVFREKQAEIVGLMEQGGEGDGSVIFTEHEIADDRLRMMFVCCHPVIPVDAQVALALKAIGGFSVGEIARAFLTSEAAVAKRLTRAKQKIVAAGIPYRTPEPEEWPSRLERVLRVIYLVFNEAYLTTEGHAAARLELAHDAEWLSALLVGWLPEEPEALGLQALLQLHLARWSARLDSNGHIVLLQDQDRSMWDEPKIEAATALIERAGRIRRPGPYQIEAAIQAVHCEASKWDATDWTQLLQLYSLLAAYDESPVVLLNRAIVLGQIKGPEAALIEVDALEGSLGRYYLFHATRASFLDQSGKTAEARNANQEALRYTTNVAERAMLIDRLADLAN